MVSKATIQNYTKLKKGSLLGFRITFSHENKGNVHAPTCVCIIKSNELISYCKSALTTENYQIMLQIKIKLHLIVSTNRFVFFLGNVVKAFCEK